MASWTVRIFSVSSSGMSISNASSKARTSSTNPSESAPRSSMKLDSGLMSFSSTSSCSLMIRLTSAGMSVGMGRYRLVSEKRLRVELERARRSLRAALDVHSAVDAQHLAGDVTGLLARQIDARGGDVRGRAGAAQRHQFDEIFPLRGRHSRRHVRV